MRDVNRENTYLKLIDNNLSRILSMFDSNIISATYGYGDRYFWGWKLIDFANGSYQGIAHGLARLVANNLLPESMSHEKVLSLIHSIFLATQKMMRKNGSLEEAFPYEASFCVTALVAFDLLGAIDCLSNRLSVEKKECYLKIIRPMIHFLKKSDETHGVISNHLATAAAALYKWQKLTHDGSDEKAKMFLGRILDNQSKDGWFLEYEGFDAGYQTLCTYYLADIYLTTQDPTLLDSLKRSIKFLKHFIHPDGSLGGVYCSRNTRFYYPAGFEMLANQIEDAAVIAQFMRKAVENETVVTLNSMDPENIAPMFNAYCLAAQYLSSGDVKFTLPCLSVDSKEIYFPGAGLYLRNSAEKYLIISYYKGGVVYVFDKNTQTSKINMGSVAKDDKGNVYTTQAYQPKQLVKVEKDRVTLLTPFVRRESILPSASKFIILRLCCVTLFRVNFLSALLKKLLVKLLITRKRKAEAINKRVIEFNSDVIIHDSWVSNKAKLKRLENVTEFSAIHMASQGYWQKQDTANKEES